MMKETINVQGMSCMNCVKSVEESVSELAGVNKVDVNLDAAQVDVSFNEAELSLATIKETIAEKGYEVN